MESTLKNQLMLSLLGTKSANGLVPEEERSLLRRLLRQWGRYLQARGIEPVASSKRECGPPHRGVSSGSKSAFRRSPNRTLHHVSAFGVV